MRWWVFGIVSTLLLLPQVAWGDGERARVGMRTVGNMEIVLYAWGPQEIIHPTRHAEPESEESMTHHLDVTVYDLGRRIYIPYLNVKATVSDRTTKREFTVALVPMIGEWLHYGANVTLPHHGTYGILIDIQPPDIPRYKHLAEVWSTPAQAVFTYSYR